jgi:hypothetical protein
MNQLIPIKQSELERLLEASRKMQTGERILKFVQSVYSIGDVIVTGRKYVAYPDQCGHGWTLFLGGKMIEEHVSLVCDTDTPERPDGHADQLAWEIGPDGNRRDPWVFQYHLPVADTETGALAVFKTGSKGGISAIGGLMAAFARNPHLGYPIIELAGDKYKNKKTGGWTDYPILRIVGHQPFVGAGARDYQNSGDAKVIDAADLPTRVDRDDDDLNDEIHDA